MPPIQVDFYILTDHAPDAVDLITCRLLEKAYVRGHQVFVYCNTQQDAEALDEHLWTFQEDSFIPHHLQGEGPHPPPPIQIGYDKEPRGFNDILLNRSTTIPSFFNKFRRIIEVIGAEEDAKATGRTHYRTYQTQGCHINTHQLVPYR